MKKLIGLKGALAVFALISALVLAGCGGEETTKTVYVDNTPSTSAWRDPPKSVVDAGTPDELLGYVADGIKAITYTGTEGFDLTGITPNYSMRSAEALGVTIILTRDFNLDASTAIITNGATLYTKNLTITADEGFVITGSTQLFVDGKLTLKVDFSGAANAEIVVNGDVDVTADVAIANGSLDVVGTLKNDTGALTLTTGNLSVGGDLTVNKGITFTAGGLTNVGGNLVVGAATSTAGTLTVGGDLTANENLTMTAGNLTVKGKTTLKKGLALVGTGTFNDLDNFATTGVLTLGASSKAIINGTYTEGGSITATSGAALGTSNIDKVIALAKLASATNNIASVSFVGGSGDVALITSDFEIPEDGGVVNFENTPVILKSGKISVGSGADLTLAKMTALGEVIIAAGGTASITGTATIDTQGKLIIQSGAGASATNVIEITGATLKNARVALGSLDLPAGTSTVVVAANPGKTIGSAANKILLNDGGKINIGNTTASVTLASYASFSGADTPPLGVGGVIVFASMTACATITASGDADDCIFTGSNEAPPKYKAADDDGFASTTDDGATYGAYTLPATKLPMFRISGGAVPAVIKTGVANKQIENGSIFGDES
jgi:hypothetical protein